MYASILELSQCGDEILERDANYTVSAMAGNTELTGDQTEELVEKFIDGRLPELAGELNSVLELLGGTVGSTPISSSVPPTMGQFEHWLHTC